MHPSSESHEQSELAALRLLVLDVDGILTDGGLWVGSDGQDWKRFAIIDGAGIKMFQEAGNRVAIISGHSSTATVHRFRLLGVEDVEIGVRDKRGCLTDLLRRRSMNLEETAAMGDDLMDLPILTSVAWSATVPEARPEVLERVHYVTRNRGGHGAVREVVEMILKAQGHWQHIISRYEA